MLIQLKLITLGLCSHSVNNNQNVYCLKVHQESGFDITFTQYSCRAIYDFIVTQSPMESQPPHSPR